MVGECREQEQGCGGHGRVSYVGGGGQMHTVIAFFFSEKNTAIA
jgi:hypothetical protein